MENRKRKKKREKGKYFQSDSRFPPEFCNTDFPTQ